MSTQITPKLPSNPIDGDQISDANGNIYEYNAEEDTWIKIGVLSSPPFVSYGTNGIITPQTYNHLKSIETLISQGIDFNKTKIYIGDHDVGSQFAHVV